MENIKLYKCYKGTCSKCLNEENPYLTEDEYKELLDTDGKVQCPEGHLECGIQELKPEDYPKQPKNYKKLVLIGGGSLFIIIVVVAILFFFTKSKVEQVTDAGKVVEKAITTIDNLTDEARDIKKDINESTNTLSQEKTEPVETTAKPVNESKTGGVSSESQKKANATVKFDYGYYEGPTVNDLPHGQGIMYFNEKHIINPKDPQKRYAEAGEYVTGVFHNGYLVNGKLFGKDKQQKEALFIGQ